MGITRTKQCVGVGVGGRRRRRSRDQAHLVDHLSNLNDDLLINILSCLSLRQAVRMCTLSKRWKLLWTCIPTLNFHPSTLRRSIPRVLTSHNPLRIIDFSFVNFSHLVGSSGELESYLRIAVKHIIQILKLDFSQNGYFDCHYPAYKLPGCIFCCYSLTKLHLSWCALDLPESMHLNSLRSLTLEYMALGDDTVECLTRSSPVLSELSLHGCNRSRDLRICIENPSVETLSFYHSGCYHSVRLYIPHVLHIKVSGLRLNYVVTGAAPSTSVELLLQDCIGRCCSCHPHHSALFDLLNGVHCSKVSFNFPLTQFFSVTELFGRHAPTTKVHCMKLDTGLSKFDVPGFVHLFKTFPDLDALVLTVQVEDIFSNLYGKPWYDKDDCKGNNRVAKKSILETFIILAWANCN